MTGGTLLHYRILENLGQGVMGVVYKALDTHLDRLVAIKVLPAEKVADLERKWRFVQEAKSASALNHPNIITIYDIASEHGMDFIAMEYVPGKTLTALEELKEESDSGTLGVVSALPRRHRHRRGWAVALVVIVGILAGTLWFVRSTSKAPEAALNPVPLTTYPGFQGEPSFSPDGNQVAFTWNGEKQDHFEIYVKLIGTAGPPCG
jgi:hypothetical protein